MKCPSCGYDCPPQFKFCGACGTSFAPAAEPAAPAAPHTRATRTDESHPLHSDERRTVTILFADISGFTAMSEKLDPEVVQEIMDHVFERLTAVIEGFGGRIDKYIGDAIMALFGAPVALGDDPERAVRAGLGMQHVMTELSEELKRTRGIPLAMRVGINTGKVIWGRVGGTSDKTYTVMGDPVNLASRLEHAAPIGGVLIGETTSRHVRGRFAIEALDPISIKGKAEPQRTFLVKGELSSATSARATLQGPRTPFVGRDAEVTALASALSAAKETGVGSVVTLEAPAGSGKSRLVLELRGEAEDRGFTQLTARASTFGQGSPYAPWSDLLARATGITGLAVAAAREKMRGWLEEHASGSGVDVRWLQELADIADESDPEIQRRREQPATFRSQLAASVVKWLGSFAAHRATLLIAEDLHWWPAPALELLAEASTVCRTTPLLILATRRPDPLAIEVWPPDTGDNRVILLQPLDPSAVRSLAHGVLGGDVPAGLIERLESVSGGNPFFAEELIQAFIDKGALHTSKERAGWQWDENKAAAADLPTTIEGVTQARIDALPPRDRRALQMAAVAGRSFWESLLVAMGEPAAGEAIAMLSARDLIHSRRSRLPGEREYAFKHATIQTVAYENALKRDRIVDHRAVAQWLEAKAAGDDLAPAIADHYLQADEPAKALPHLLRASEEAVRVFEKVDQAAAVFKAAEIAEQVGDSAKLGTALRLRGRLRRIGGQPEAEADLKKAMGLCATQGEIAMAGRELGGFFLWRGRLDEAERVAEETLTAARSAALPRIEATALNQLALVSLHRGDFARSMERYVAGLEVAERAAIVDAVGLLLIGIGNLHLQAGRARDAIATLTRALACEMSRENECFTRSNLGAAYSDLGMLDASERELQDALRAATRIGLRLIEAEALVRLGYVVARAGKRIDGLSTLERGLALAREIEAFEVLEEGLCRRADLGIDRTASEADLQEAQMIAAKRHDSGALARIEAKLASIRAR